MPPPTSPVDYLLPDRLGHLVEPVQLVSPAPVCHFRLDNRRLKLKLGEIEDVAVDRTGRIERKAANLRYDRVARLDGVAVNGCVLEDCDRQCPYAPPIERVINGGFFRQRMLLPNGGSREDAAVDRLDADAIRLIALVLVKQIGVLEDVLVAALDSRGGAFLADENTSRLILR